MKQSEVLRTYKSKIRYKPLAGTWCFSFINGLCKQHVSERRLSGGEFCLGLVCNGESFKKEQQKNCSEALWRWGDGVTGGRVLPYKYPDLPNAPSPWAPPPWPPSALPASPRPARALRSLAERGSCCFCWNGRPGRAEESQRQRQGKSVSAELWGTLPQGGAARDSLCLRPMTMLNAFTLKWLTSSHLWRVRCLRPEI